MKGTRPLDNKESRLVSACFDGTFEHRNRGLFMLGVSTGGRISELLFDKSIAKGSEVFRGVLVNSDGRVAIENLIDWHAEKYKTIAPSSPLFPF